MTQTLNTKDRNLLLMIARDAITASAKHEALKPIEAYDPSPILLQNGASFVTLTKAGYLRGCIGTLQAFQNLAQDVQDHAIQAAMEDPRFPPVQAVELPQIHIEISRLSEPQPLRYDRPEKLIKLLKPHHDGVILKSGYRRATFLPQVWDQIPKPEDFLGQLCLKMGVSANFWKTEQLEVFTYSVESFEE